MFKKTAFILIFLMLSSAFVSAQTSKDLDDLKARIKALEAQLNALAGEKSSTVKSITVLQKKIAAERQAVFSITSEIEANNVRLARLWAEEKELSGRRTALEEQAKLSMFFLLDNSGDLTAKSVLAGANTADFTAVVELTGILGQNINEQVGEYLSIAENLAFVRSEISERNEALVLSRSERQKLMSGYAASQKELDNKLMLVRQDEAAQKEYLQMLKAEQDSITKALAEAARSHSVKMPAAGTFSALRGKLPWPVAGKVIEPYGEKYIEEAGVTIINKGIKIAPSRSAVRSIADGVVVYSTYVSGMQNVVIVQHDIEYYSIYGGLDEFYTVNSMAVKQGDDIGRINIDLKGNSAYVYFEIRRHEQALNPSVWLQK